MSAKSSTLTPVTFSLNTTVQPTLLALVRMDAPRVIDKTVGGVASELGGVVPELDGVVPELDGLAPMLNVSPTNPPLPRPVPPNGLPTRSTIESSSTSLRPSVPEPGPVVAIT